MIRTILLLPLFLSLTIGVAFAQDLPKIKKTGKYGFTTVVHVESGSTKDQLYSLARMWFAKEFTSAKDVIQMEDKEAGVIVGKGNFKVGKLSWLVSDEIGNAGWVEFTLSVFVKDGRYKYEITDFFHKPNRAYGAGSLDNPKRMNSKSSFLSIKNKTLKDMDRLLASLEKHMEQKTVAGDDNW